MVWKILTLLALLTPLAMVILGLICWRIPPKGPTWALGFRSRRARAGDESWKFAQSWAGKLWFILGLIWLVATLLISNGQKETGIEDCLEIYLNLVGLQLGTLILVILGINLALLIRFDRFGRIRVKKEKVRKKPRPERTPAEDAPEDFVEESAEYPETGEYMDEAFEEYSDEAFGEYGDEDLPPEDEPFYDPGEEFFAEDDPEDAF